jgi:hypothetical protein
MEQQSMHTSISLVRSNRVAWARRALGAALTAGCLLLWACHKAAPPTDAAASAEEKPGASAKPHPAAKGGADTKNADAKGGADAKEGADTKESADTKEKGDAKEEGVTLTPEQIEKLGIVTQVAQSTDYSEEAAGFGVVISHETIAQGAAELATAQATERLSRSALQRAKKLTGTPGAVSADAEETAAQKAEVDAAALTLTTRRLSSTLGMNPPWKNGNNAILEDLAGGKIKLVRVTFPLGALGAGIPASVRAAHIGAGKAVGGWKMNVVWDAPADVNIPGRSFHALLKGSDAGEGERLQVWTPVGPSVSGVMIPAAAAVMSEGKYWCYVEKKPGTFERTEIDTARPTADGYFVTDGVAVGDKIVTTSAGQLLAKESGSGAEPD